jgi:hypothetical protein
MPGPTEEEFKNWYPVGAAVELLMRSGFDADNARRSILDGLRRGEIQSAAERTLKVSMAGGNIQDLPFAYLRAPHWLVDTPADSFWDDGNGTFRKSGAPDFVYRHAGIRFKPADIDKLAAEKRRASPRPWVAARDAAAVLRYLHSEPLTAQAAITEHAAGGLIRTRCKRRTIREHDKAGVKTETHDDLEVFTEFWESFEQGQLRQSADWQMGSFATLHYMRGDWYTIRIFGVEFSREDLAKLAGVSAEPEIAPEPRGPAQIMTEWKAREAARLASEEPPAAPAKVRISRVPPPIMPLAVVQHAASTAAYNPAPVMTPDDVAREFAPYALRGAERGPTSRAAAASPVTSSNPRRKAPRSKGKPITHDEFMAWYRELPLGDQARGYRWVWAEAKRHFRPRTRVLKSWAEELSKDRGSGRKPNG